MTTNAKKALAGVLRSSAGTVISTAEAVASLSAEDLLAAMSDEQRTGLQAALANASTPSAGATDDGDEDDKSGTCSNCKEPMKDGKCAKCAPKSGTSDGAGAHADSFAAANARALAVMGSEHFAANAALAKTLLANDKLSADEINAALAVASGGTNSAQVEAAQRAAMKEVLDQNQNSNIDAGNGGAGANANQDDGSAGWKKATAAANARYGL